MKRYAHIALVILTLVLVAACDDDNSPTSTPTDNGPFDLTFTGMIAPHAGQMLHVALVRDSDGTVIETETETVGSDGSFSFSWTDALAKGESYHIDFYADHNSSGSCDAPPADHAWREVITGAGANVTVDFQHNTNFTDVCGSF